LSAWTKKYKYRITVYKLHIVLVLQLLPFLPLKKTLLLPLKCKEFFGELLPKGRELRGLLRLYLFIDLPTKF